MRAPVCSRFYVLRHRRKPCRGFESRRPRHSSSELPGVAPETPTHSSTLIRLLTKRLDSALPITDRLHGRRRAAESALTARDANTQRARKTVALTRPLVLRSSNALVLEDPDNHPTILGLTLRGCVRGLPACSCPLHQEQAHSSGEYCPAVPKTREHDLRVPCSAVGSMRHCPPF
jgi:hypothetical protein